MNQPRIDLAESVSTDFHNSVKELKAWMGPTGNRLTLLYSEEIPTGARVQAVRQLKVLQGLCQDVQDACEKGIRAFQSDEEKQGD